MVISAQSPFRFFKLRTLLLLSLYAMLCGFSYLMAFQLRFDFNVPTDFNADMVRTIWWIVGLKLLLLALFGQVDAILAYFRLSDVTQLFIGLLLGGIFLAILWYVYSGAGMPPRAVILADFLLSFLLITGFRVAMRIRASSRMSDWLHLDKAENVIIVGAGEVGAGVCSELRNKSRFGMRPVALLDDDTKKIGRYVHGVPVAGSVDQLTTIARRYDADKVIVAFPSAPVRRIKEMVELARKAKLRVESVPAIMDLVSGRAKITELHPIEVEDLLGRDVIGLNSDQIHSMLSGKRILITGAGGSIGRELVLQVLSYAPKALLCIDQAEIAAFNLQQTVLQPHDHSGVAKMRVLNVCDVDAMEGVFDQFEPEIVFHAAAHKHVCLMESQPAEAIKNNFFATAQLARIASRLKVEHFILISTDKAINPSSVMGVSKRLAELALFEQQQVTDNQTHFMSVRFGNVLGSSGSVIEVFKKQIKDGGPITVTDPNVTRFFMTVQEAAGLILQSAAQGEGGEIFVLDMGEPIKIVDIARQMIALSGYQEGRDIEVEFVGLNPGEKLYEEVQHLSETLQPTNHPRVMRFATKEKSIDSMDSATRALKIAISTNDIKRIKQSLQKYVPEYTPYLES